MQDASHWTMSVSVSTYKHRLPSLISRRNSDSVRPQHTGQCQVRPPVGMRDALVMAIAGTIIGQHPPNHNMSDTHCPSEWVAL
jgi:hypothetical protein